mmetsp:Transcript_9627/g.14501  ORF Transcript_9627/g.14501 Transcript_9627/m.14501 type:complete len:100 (+) Transcript_9627:62-361(+)
MSQTNSSEQPEYKIQIKREDMSDALKEYTIKVCQHAVQSLSGGTEQELAEYIKLQFDKEHGKHWHVVVGRNFGSFVTHESQKFIHFYIDELAFVIFKAG